MADTSTRGGTIVEVGMQGQTLSTDEHKLVVDCPALSVYRFALATGSHCVLGQSHHGLTVLALSGQVMLAGHCLPAQLSAEQLLYVSPRESCEIKAREPSVLIVTMLTPPPLDPVEEASEESFPASDPPARTPITGEG